MYRYIQWATDRLPKISPKFCEYFFEAAFLPTVSIFTCLIRKMCYNLFK